MLVDLPSVGEAPTERFEPTFDARREAARDHEPNATRRTHTQVRPQLGEWPKLLLEPHMHRTHEDAVRKDYMTEVQRLE